MKRLSLISALLFTAAASQMSAATAAVGEAVAALQRQDYKTAELKLVAELKLHPGDAETLSLLGVALDGQKRFPEARQTHQKAMASAPRSPAILNNYANSLLAAGDEKGSRDIFLKTLALDPAERYANLQLAQLALRHKDGKEALIYLDHLSDALATPSQSGLAGPEVGLMRLIALDFAGDRAAADVLFSQLVAAADKNPRIAAENGWALAQAGQFAQAETLLSQALAADPANFQILYGLGLAATEAGHLERARDVLESALRQKPKDVDALYALAFVYNAMRQPELTIRTLAQAAQLAPQRADVQKLLAVTTGDIKAHEDSVAAWERYMKLVPGDDAARRERGFEKAHMGLFTEALPDLEWFAARHPNDAVGLYELGVAEGANDPTKGIANLNRAITLQPDFTAARSARGSLQYLRGNAEAALPDLEYVVKQPSIQPGARAAMLDRLGQAYMALDRLADAVSALRKAAESAPADSATQLHLANALAQAGQTEESDALMAKFRELRPGGNAPPVRGVVDYLSMTPEQRHDDYKARLEKTVKEHPDDTNAQLLYLKLLLSDNQSAEAAAAARRLAALKPPAGVLADAGRAMLGARQYPVAKELLDQAGAAASAPVEVRLDMALATFHAAGGDAAAAKEALDQLARVPETGHTPDYYQALAQLLDAAGMAGEAIDAMKQALRAAPDRPDFYWRAAALMTIHERAGDAIRLLDDAAKTLPLETQIPVIRAAILALTGKSEEALRILTDTQHRSPEFAAVWAARGMILAGQNNFDEAHRALATALALGAHSPEVRDAFAATAARGTADPATLFLTRPLRDW